MGPHLIFNTSSELLPFVAEGCIVTRDLGFVEKLKTARSVSFSWHIL